MKLWDSFCRIGNIIIVKIVAIISTIIFILNIGGPISWFILHNTSEGFQDTTRIIFIIFISIITRSSYYYVCKSNNGKNEDEDEFEVNIRNFDSTKKKIIILNICILFIIIWIFEYIAS